MCIKSTRSGFSWGNVLLFCLSRAHQQVRLHVVKMSPWHQIKGMEQYSRAAAINCVVLVSIHLRGKEKLKLVTSAELQACNSDSFAH